MSASTGPDPNKKGRGHRVKKDSRKATEILESDQISPGLVSPAASKEKGITLQPLSPTQQTAATTMPKDRAVLGASLRANVPTFLQMGTLIEYDGQPVRLPNFGMKAMLIYDWPAPRPKHEPGSGSFLPLAAHHLRAKNRQDAEQKENDCDQELDVWETFAGPFVPGANNFDVLRVVSSTFVKRAKRAFWAGKSWEGFIKTELSAVPDEEELPNEIRLAVWERLKARLCEEIWLQPYPGQDSKIPTPEADVTKQAAILRVPHPESQLREATEDQPQPAKRARTQGPTKSDPNGIKKWVRDSLGTLQPLYEDETEPPSMDRHLASFRRDKEADKGQLKLGTRSGHHMTRDLSTAQVRGVALSGRPNFLPSFDESMKQTMAEMETSGEEDG